jgi:recombinational DNA repair ATPase RecF
MRIHRMRLANYRGVVERELTFDTDGVTVIEGDNEIGKSSIAEALDLLLDHYDDTSKAAVRATKPVSRDAGAEVEVELTVGPYRCTYAKRFHRDRYTRLTITSPTPAGPRTTACAPSSPSTSTRRCGRRCACTRATPWRSST